MASARWPGAVAAGSPAGSVDLLALLTPPAPGCAERVFQARVEGLLAHFALEWYHANVPLLDRRGFPDLVIVGRAVLYRELKTARGALSPDQVRWRDRLQRAGADWALWRPADWAALVADLAACAGVENPLSRLGGLYVTGRRTQGARGTQGRTTGHQQQSPAEVPTRQGTVNG